MSLLYTYPVAHLIACFVIPWYSLYYSYTSCTPPRRLDSTFLHWLCLADYQSALWVNARSSAVLASHLFQSRAGRSFRRLPMFSGLWAVITVGRALPAIAHFARYVRLLGAFHTLR